MTLIFRSSKYLFWWGFEAKECGACSVWGFPLVHLLFFATSGGRMAVLKSVMFCSRGFTGEQVQDEMGLVGRVPIKVYLPGCAI